MTALKPQIDKNFILIKTFQEDFEGTRRPKCFCGVWLEEEYYDHDFDCYICPSCNGIVREE